MAPDACSPTLLADFDRFVAPILRALRRPRSRRLACTYAQGLLGPAERKTASALARQARGQEHAPALVRDMAEVLAADDWDASQVMARGARALQRETDAWDALVIDDTALLKQGTQSVGVTNQYAGCVGGLANCQVLVTVSLATEHVSAPLTMQLFLPPAWDRDAERRARCGVPAYVRHVPKWKLALEQLRFAHEEGAPRRPVLADALYGAVTEFRLALDAEGWSYVVGIALDLTFWDATTRFEPVARPDACGRASTRLRALGQAAPRDVNAVCAALPLQAWTNVVWRHGTRGVQRGRFAAVRVRPARGYVNGGVGAADLQPEQWLLVHWPADAAEPTKAWVSNLPADTPLATLVALARLRWRIERDYQEGKGLLGLDHFEGRSWHGLHHHAALVTVAHQFLALQRVRALRATPAAPPPAACEAAFSPCV